MLNKQQEKLQKKQQQQHLDRQPTQLIYTETQTHLCIHTE